MSLKVEVLIIIPETQDKYAFNIYSTVSTVWTLKSMKYNFRNNEGNV